jgi:hypothetical protein
VRIVAGVGDAQGGAGSVDTDGADGGVHPADVADEGGQAFPFLV